MIVQLLEVLADPSAYAATIRDGEIVVEEIAELEARGARVLGLPPRGSRGSGLETSGGPILSDETSISSDGIRIASDGT